MSNDLILLTLDPDLEPWERQPDETTRRYDQFRRYMDAGRGRTFADTATTLARHPAYIRAVAAAYLWRERAEAHDRHLDERHEQVWLDERRKAAEHDARLLNGATALAASRLQTINAMDLDPPDLIRLIDVIMRQRRALFGGAADLAVTVTAGAGDPLAAQLAAFTAMDGEARRIALGRMAEDVLRRSSAVAGGDDDG